MMRYLGAFAMAAPLFVAVVAEPALAQKSGGILKMYSPDSPASMSVHEEATFVAEGPMMGVFNNLVMFDQHIKQNSLGSIVSRSRDRLVMERGWDRPDIAIARGCEMARWQALHGQGCPMHL